MYYGNVVLTGVLLICTFISLAPAADPKSVEFFENRIRPVLVEHRCECHSAEALAKRKLKEGLQLDTRDGLRKGGDSGLAIVVGKARESRLIKALRYDGQPKMPPKGKVSDAVIADIETWIDAGAADPRSGGAVRQRGLSIEEGRKFWSYKPVQKPSIPIVKDRAWLKNDIDAFILCGIEASGLRPAPDAPPATLLRRISYDLIGLPPSREEVDRFVRAFKADGDAAYEAEVDRLLASPHFGERWGRHWLDVARFGESITLRGTIFKEAWRYRDYVIDSFNKDVPFDRFIREQIAGDLLPADSVAQRRRQLIATTYLALDNTNLEEQDKKQLVMDVVDEQLDAIAKGILAQTVTCARCHDHKFDPIPTKDYYALAGILRNTKTLKHANLSEWLEMPLPEEPLRENALREHEAAIAAATRDRRAQGHRRQGGAARQPQQAESARRRRFAGHCRGRCPGEESRRVEGVEVFVPPMSGRATFTMTTRTRERKH